MSRQRQRQQCLLLRFNGYWYSAKCTLTVLMKSSWKHYTRPTNYTFYSPNWLKSKTMANKDCFPFIAFLMPNTFLSVYYIGSEIKMLLYTMLRLTPPSIHSSKYNLFIYCYLLCTIIAYLMFVCFWRPMIRQDTLLNAADILYSLRIHADINIAILSESNEYFIVFGDCYLHFCDRYDATRTKLDGIFKKRKI